MSKGRKKPSLYDLSREQLDSPEDFTSYWQEIGLGSDRSAALVASTAVDHALVQLIRTKLIDLSEPEQDELFFERYSTLGTFAERIDIAYVLGLISASEKADLDIIRRVRNTFAHSVKGVSFQTKLISNECDKLKNYKSPNPDGIIITTARQKYMETLHTLYLSFLMKKGKWQDKEIRRLKRLHKKLKLI